MSAKKTLIQQQKSVSGIIFLPTLLRTEKQILAEKKIKLEKFELRYSFILNILKWSQF